MLKLLIVSFIFLAIIVPNKSAYAMASVGIGTGKIEIEPPLEPNTPKVLDSIAVYNDGDQTGKFQMEVMFNETQPELKPKSDWITFSPENFELDSGESQIVEVTITLPEWAESGEYFAYLEAHLIKKTEVESVTSTSIGAAAATKLSFTVSEPKIQGNQPITMPIKEPMTSSTPIIFERMNDYFVASDKTKNNLLSVSPIM